MKYWAERNAVKAKDLMPSKQKLARQHKGLCPRCGDALFNGEEIHTHHRIPQSEGGKDSYSNLEIVHLFCHQQIHKKAA